jgi:hypothetical protein
VLGQADVSCVLGPPSSTMGAENIRNLQRLRGCSEFRVTGLG